MRQALGKRINQLRKGKGLAIRAVRSECGAYSQD